MTLTHFTSNISKNFFKKRPDWILRGLEELIHEKTWVRSFSRPEKLPLKIHTGSSGTVYSYWVEKALLFPNWSSFSRQMPSPYVSNSCGFSLKSEVWSLKTKISCQAPFKRNIYKNQVLVVSCLSWSRTGKTGTILSCICFSHKLLQNRKLFFLRGFSTIEGVRYPVKTFLK